MKATQPVRGCGADSYRAEMTVKTPLPVPLPPSGLFTVTSCDPIVALAPTVTGTVRVVELTNVTAPGVMFASSNETVAPFWRPVPVMVTVALALPWLIMLGDVAVTVGGAVTVNRFTIPSPPSGFVTITSCVYSPAEAPTVTGTVMVVELTTVTAPIVMLPSPNDTVAPLWNPVPVMVTVVIPLPRALELGDIEVICGPAETVKTPFPVPAPPSGLLTVTLWAPTVAPWSTLTGTVIVVEFTT